MNRPQPSPEAVSHAAGDARRQELVNNLQRTGDGSVDAFGRLYDSTSAKLFGIVVRILSDRNEAEDVLQDVYATVWRKSAEFDSSRASPITWLATIARNRAIDRLRLRGNRRAEPIEAAHAVPDGAPGADTLAERSDAMNHVEHALNRLDPRHASAIRSAYLDGMTYEALALREGVPVGTLKTWVHRGMAKVRAELSD